MLRSMYAGVSGMKSFQTKLDVIGNNISNVNTIGYKKSTVSFQDLLSQNLSGNGVNPMQVGLGTSTSAITVQHTQGSAMATGNGTDLTIIGDGFFVVRDPNGGQEYLTRAGNFLVDDAGNLVTQQGFHVLNSEGAPIAIDREQFISFTINQQGLVEGRMADGTNQQLGTIGVAAPGNPSALVKAGGSLYEMAEGITLENAVAANSKIASGQLEMSNVDLTEEFTEMIVAQRGFQANSRTVTVSDEILQEVVNLKR